MVLAVNLLGASYVATEGDPLNEQRRVLADHEELRPSHLAQTTLFSVTWRVARAAGAERPFVVLQTTNALLGAAAAALILLILLRLRAPHAVAIFTALVWAVSFAPWLHSKTAETGVTPVPFLLGALFLLIRARDGATPPIGDVDESERARCWAGVFAAVLIAAAISLSLYTVLLVPGYLYLAWRRGVLIPGTAALAVLVGVPFGLAVASSGATDLPSVIAVLTHHPNAEMLGSSFNLMSLPRALSGVGRLLFPFALGESAIKMKLAGHSVDMGLSEWWSLARNTGGALMLLLAVVVAWWRMRRRTLGWFVLLSGLPVAVFCVYWLGSDPQFWIPFYSVMLIAIGATVGDLLSVPYRRYVFGGITVLLLLFMFMTNRSFGPPCPLAPLGSERWQSAQELSATLPGGAVILIPGPMVHLPFGLLRGARTDVDVVHLAADERFEGRDELFLEDLAAFTGNAMRGARRMYAFVGEGSLTPASLGAWEGLATGRGVSRAELGEFLAGRFSTGDSAMGGCLVELAPAEDGGRVSNGWTR